MASEKKIEILRAECEDRLAIVNAAFEREVAKVASDRHPSVLLFLDRERHVYTFGLKILREIEEASCSIVEIRGASPE